MEDVIVIFEKGLINNADYNAIGRQITEAISNGVTKAKVHQKNGQIWEGDINVVRHSFPS